MVSLGSFCSTTLRTHLLFFYFHNLWQCNIQRLRFFGIQAWIPVSALRGVAEIEVINYTKFRSQWQRGLRRRSAAARLLRLWVRIPPRPWMFVCCDFCVLSGRGLCDELITRPEESYRLWCVVVCDLETSWMRRPWPTGGGCRAKNKQTNYRK